MALVARDMMWTHLPLVAQLKIGDALTVLSQQVANESMDLVVTSPPFVGLRTYSDDPRELGRHDPHRWVVEMLEILGEIRRVLTPWGSVVVEIGDSYSGSGGAGGDYGPGGLREGRPLYKPGAGDWPLPKSLCAIPAALQFALTWGVNPFTGEASEAGQWIVRNAGAWVKPNPRPGEERDKFRPGWSSVLMATMSPHRYFHQPAARTQRRAPVGQSNRTTSRRGQANGFIPKEGDPADGGWDSRGDPDTAHMTDVFRWAIGAGKAGAGHVAPFPEALVYRMVDTMCPLVVCQQCGFPSRWVEGEGAWTDCGHDQWRRGRVLDPFVGSGTTMAVANGMGRDALGIDLDRANADRVRKRMGGLFLEVHDEEPLAPWRPIDVDPGDYL